MCLLMPSLIEIIANEGCKTDSVVLAFLAFLGLLCVPSRVQGMWTSQTPTPVLLQSVAKVTELLAASSLQSRPKHTEAARPRGIYNSTHIIFAGSQKQTLIRETID